MVVISVVELLVLGKEYFYYIWKLVFNGIVIWWKLSEKWWKKKKEERNKIKKKFGERSGILIEKVE